MGEGTNRDLGSEIGNVPVFGEAAELFAALRLTEAG